MKKLTTLISIWAISLLLIGCVSAPEVKREPLPTVRENIAELTYTPIKPVELPEKFKGKVTRHTDANGKVWALVEIADLDRIKAAYLSAEGNAKLVDDLNNYSKLVVDRANMIRDLAILEEYRNQRLELRIEEERESAAHQRKMDSIDLWIWKLTTILALAAGL